MRALLLCLTLAQPPGETPGELHLQAFVDLTTVVDPAKRRDTRYLSLAAVAPDQRDAYMGTLAFALNSASWRSTLTRPERIAPALVRIDLAALGWDAAGRAKRIARLKGQGVDTTPFRADLWEEVARADPYFFTTVWDGYRYLRGWLDPAADEGLREQSHASKAIVSATWLVSRLLLDDVPNNRGGLYSQALLLPATEVDLYKAMGVDLKLVDADAQLKSGGAVLDSVVALHNRELQLTPSLYGFDEKFVWRSFDVASDDAGPKSVLDSLAGSLARDGGEYIGTLPNGLYWYWVGNAEGKQLAVVPQAVAIDQRSGAFDRIKDRSVVNAYKCIDCHAGVNGLWPFGDVVGKTLLAPDVGLAVLSKDKALAADKLQATEDYYLSGLAGKLGRQQASYAARVKAVSGLDSGSNGVAVTRAVEGYLYDLVTPEQAAREMGRTVAEAKILWRASGNNQFIVLGSGQPIRRGALEKAWPDAMRADHYPWDKGH